LPADNGQQENLGQVVTEVTERMSVLVREEIELAKAEIQQKVTRIAKGAAFGAVAGVFLLFMLIYLLEGLSWFWNDLFNFNAAWPGFAITTGGLLVLGLIAGLLAARFFKKGTPPMPELAIEEAKKTREVLEEARS